ncbi:MAG: DUF262 domain-containing HNH endonuclease family protein [Cyanobacteriota bacterium]
MTKEKLEAKEICIDDLFGDKYLFEVPIYQRPFVWEEENFEQLFTDIKNEMEKNRNDKGNTFEDYEPYFLGSIVLHTTKYKDDESGTYDIIDGRQRLVSLSILMAVLRDFAAFIGYNDGKKTMQDKIIQEESKSRRTKESVRITTKQNEKDFFKKYILTEGGTRKIDNLNEKELQKLRDKLNESEKHMLDAIKVFQRSFRSEAGDIDHELLENYITYLLLKVFIVVVKTSSVVSAFRLFKTLNKRGIPLTSADLLKSDNLSVIAEDKRQEYAQKWEDIEQDLGIEKLEKLINFIRLIEIPSRQQRELFEDFEKRIYLSKDCSFKKGYQFIECLSNVKEIYQEKIEQGKITLEGFDQADKQVYYYNIISIMKKFLIFDEWMAAVIYFSQKFNDDLYLYEFLKKLERRIVVDWISGATQERRVSLIYATIKLIKSSGKASQVLSDSIFRVEEKRNAFESALDNISFYNRGGNKKIARYCLIRIDMERSDNSNKRSSYEGEITVERILPNVIKDNDEYWIKRFNEEQRTEWTARLGNLTLLHGRINSKASNKSFPEKKAYYFQKKRKSSFDVTNELKNYTEWSLEGLQDRHKRLKEEAIEIWIDSETRLTKSNFIQGKGFALDTNQKR